MTIQPVFDTLEALNAFFDEKKENTTRYYYQQRDKLRQGFLHALENIESAREAAKAKFERENQE